jgi:hypothetical protein
MSGNRRPRRGGRTSNRQPSKPKSLWDPVPAPDAPEAIRISPEPAALIVSLGAPPLRGASSTEHYIAAVVERAAGLAAALAASAELLAEPDGD